MITLATKAPSVSPPYQVVYDEIKNGNMSSYNYYK